MAIQRTHPRVVVRRFGPVRIWRDELSEIVAIIQQVHPVSVLEVDEYTCDQVDDLAELEKLRVARFALTSEDGLVSLLLDEDAAHISAVEPDLTTMGMLGEVERIATRHSRSRLFSLLRLPLMVTTTIFASVTFVVYGLVLGPLPNWLLIVLAGLVAGPLASSAGGGSLAQAILYTRTKAEAPTWLSRNRDALITNVIVSAAFLVIGIVIGQAN
jgi:hypothetical protein